MKKLSEINEGFWKDGIKRAKSNEKRIEDITEFDKYIETIEWVDMGDSEYLYAKFDYDEMFSMEDLSKLKLPEGISIATTEEINIVRINATLYLSGRGEYLVCQSDDGKTIYFNKPTYMTSSMYACSVTEESKRMMRMSPYIISSDMPYLKHAGAMNVFLDCNAGRKKTVFIKLIKLK